MAWHPYFPVAISLGQLSLYFLGFFEDNDERGLRFAEHGRVASFGAQCGCLGAYDRPSYPIRGLSIDPS